MCAVHDVERSWMSFASALSVSEVGFLRVSTAVWTPIPLHPHPQDQTKPIGLLTLGRREIPFTPIRLFLF